MSVISLLSAKGAPGVTTTAVALAHESPAVTGREVLMFDADPLGGDTNAGVLRGGAPASAGALALASDRTTAPVEAVLAASVPLTADGRGRLIPGIPDASRAGALPIAWDRLAGATPGDILVDAGRFEPRGALPSWIDASDLVLLVVRPQLPDVRAAQRMLASWPGSTARLRLLVVATPAPYTARQVAQALELPLAAQLSWDSRAAAVYCYGEPPARHHQRSAFLRDVRIAAANCAEDLETSHA